MRYQLDEHVPHAIAHALRRRGIDILTLTDAGMLGRPDVEVLARACTEGRVVITQDPDFLRLHDERPDHVGIAYCAQGSSTVGQMVASLVLIHEVYTPDEMAGRLEYR